MAFLFLAGADGVRLSADYQGGLHCVISESSLDMDKFAVPANIPPLERQQFTQAHTSAECTQKNGSYVLNYYSSR